MAKKKGIKADSDKVQVTYNKSQLDLIDNFKGIFGNSRAEIVRNIVTNWLFDKKK
jgi:hypothetical protein